MDAGISDGKAEPKSQKGRNGSPTIIRLVDVAASTQAVCSHSAQPAHLSLLSNQSSIYLTS